MRLEASIARRHVAVLLATALVAPPIASRAEYGQGANVAAPAFLPSPIRPTGEMAKTCEVVALGRDDVCLEFKKLLTSYDELQAIYLPRNLQKG